jgi:rod shape-determining protein MreC
VLKPGQQVITYASVGDQPEVPGVPVGTITSVTASAGSLTQTALVRPVVNFTALGVVGVVVQVPAYNPRVSVLPRPAPTVTVTTTPHPATSSTLAPQVYPSSSGLPAGSSVSPAPSASRSAGG